MRTLKLLCCVLLLAMPAVAKKKEPAKVFTFINLDESAYLVYFGCVGLNSSTQELLPKDPEKEDSGQILFEGNENACSMMIRPKEAIHKKIFQRRCEADAIVTIENGRASISGCKADVTEEAAK